VSTCRTDPSVLPMQPDTAFGPGLRSPAPFVIPATATRRTGRAPSSGGAPTAVGGVMQQVVDDRVQGAGLGAQFAVALALNASGGRTVAQTHFGHTPGNHRLMR